MATEVATLYGDSSRFFTGDFSMFHALKTLLRDEEGASIVEYALLLALVALVVITAATTLGNNLSSFFNSTAGSI